MIDTLNIAANAAQEIAGKVIDATPPQNEFAQLLEKFGLAVDVGTVVVIVILIQLIKPRIKEKWPGLLYWLPLIVSAVVTFFFSGAAQMIIEGEKWFSIFTAWTKDALMYTAGCYVAYNLVWERLLGSGVKLKRKKK